MEIKQLTENHPTYKKVEELAELATKLGITITVGCNNQLKIIDDQFPNLIFEYRDSEQYVGGYDTTSEFPYCSETKLIYIVD